MNVPPAQLKRSFERRGLGGIARDLIAASRPGIQLTRRRGAAGVGASKLGGAPDMPVGARWPKRRGRPLAFLAQMDLRKASRFDEERLLPVEGLLLFFYDFAKQPWGFDPADRGGALVLYVPPEARLRRIQPPRGSLGADIEQSSFSECPVGFRAMTTYPGMGSRAYVHKRANDLLRGLSETIQAGQGEDKEPLHQLLGHAVLIQDAMEEECQLVTNGINMGGEDLSRADSRRAKKLASGARDWTLLLQLDSDGKPEWMWGDVGVLYFWIRRPDLAKGDFSRIWCILQCT